jgi:hypothetical protein
VVLDYLHLDKPDDMIASDAPEEPKVLAPGAVPPPGGAAPPAPAVPPQ